jgi:type IV pilus assembly protein PilW
MMRARGFSLVELMVAITLALIVTAGVMSVFIGSRSAYQSTSGVAAVSDSGRFALNFLEGAVRDAGNMACGAPVRTIFNVGPGTPLNTPPLPTLAFQPITGFEAVGTDMAGAYNVSVTLGAPANWLSPIGWAAGLDPAFGSLAAALPPALPVVNNDILVVRSSTRGATPAYVTNAPNGANSFDVVTIPGTFKAGQLAIISDCVKSLIFQISGVGGTTVSHTTGGFPGNLTNTFPAQVNFDPGSEVTLLQTTAYYIGVGADGDGALFSADLSAGNSFTSVAPAPVSPNELVPDIEAMQILYGLDTTGTRTVSQWVSADQVPDFSSVMSVHIAVLAAGPPGSAKLGATAVQPYVLLGTQVTAPVDTRNRQIFDVTIGVRNLLP